MMAHLLTHDDALALCQLLRQVDFAAGAAFFQLDTRNGIARLDHTDGRICCYSVEMSRPKLCTVN